MVLKKTLESPLDCKEIQPVHPKGESWVFIGRTDVEAETPVFGHLMWRADSFERDWCWERLRAGREGDSRGWDGWMVSPTQWTWVWMHSGSWWWTGKTGMLQSMGLQRVQHDWMTALNSLCNLTTPSGTEVNSPQFQYFEERSVNSWCWVLTVLFSFDSVIYSSRKIGISQWAAPGELGNLWVYSRISFLLFVTLKFL